MRIDATALGYRELNRRVREAIAAGEKEFELTGVNGQRYIADGIRGDGITLTVRGVPGNDLGAFMDGPTVTVYGNAQDGVANTMNSGRIIVHGQAGDVLGYGMRGGELFVRGRVGYRVGIHMKAYQDRLPVIVAGGTAGDFLGEYMAGGLLIVLGLDRRPGEPLIGDWCGTGMHGGAIYLRGQMTSGRGDPLRSPGSITSVSVHPADEADRQLLLPHLTAFAAAFSLEAQELLSDGFTRITPISHRPYGAKYAT
jgi:glutamate synthase domain-containing protein 3